MKRLWIALACSTALVAPALAHQSCGHVGQPACSDGWRADGVAAPESAGVGSAGSTGGSGVATDAAAASQGVESGAGEAFGSGECGVLEQWVRDLCQGGFAINGKRIAECDGFYFGELGGVLPVEGCNAKQPLPSASETQEVAVQPADGLSANTPAEDTTVAVSGTDALGFDSAADMGALKNGAAWFDANAVGSTVGYIDFASSPNFMVAPNVTGPMAKYRSVAINNGKLTLTARRIDPSDAGAKAVIDRAHALQNDGGNITWAGAQVALPGMTINPGDSVEARIKTSHDVNGMGGAFWLYGKASEHEVDILDMTGWGAHPQTHLHNGGSQDDSMEISHQLKTSDWHTYRFDYKPNAMTVSIDNNPSGTFSGGIASSFKDPLYPLLSFGGDIYHKTPANVNTMTMDVDYVRKIPGGK